MTQEKIALIFSEISSYQIFHDQTFEVSTETVLWFKDNLFLGGRPPVRKAKTLARQPYLSLQYGNPV